MLTVGSGGTKKQGWQYSQEHHGTTEGGNQKMRQLRERGLFARDEEDEFGFCYKVSGNRNRPEEILE